MPVLPMLTMQNRSPFEGFLSGLGQGVGGGMADASQQHYASQWLDALEGKSPQEQMQILMRAPSNIRNQLGPMLQQQEQSQQQREAYEQQKKTRDLEIQNIEKLREQEFTNLVGERFEGDDADRKAFLGISDKYNNISDPDKRYLETQKDWKNYKAKVDSFQESLGKLGTVASVAGASRSQLSRLSDHTSALRKDGIPDSVIENIVNESSFLSPIDKERVLTPNFSAIEKLVRSIKSLPTPAPLIEQKITNKSKKAISEAVKRGASLDYLFSELMDKNFKEKNAIDLIQAAAREINLTDRQAKQLNNMKLLKNRELSKFFGR